MCQIDAFVSHSAFGSNSGAGEPLRRCETENQKCIEPSCFGNQLSDPNSRSQPAIHAGLPFSMPPPKVLKAYARWDETCGGPGMFLLGAASFFCFRGVLLHLKFQLLTVCSS